MAGRLQLRRGTTSQNDAFTGAVGELTMDTQKKQLRLHDGATLGGCGTIDPVVAFQLPTADNGYTWYRKYASGWVEQGGIVPPNSGTSGTVILPVEMLDTNYTVLSNNGNNNANNYFTVNTTNSMMTTEIHWFKSATNMGGSWEVKGMAA